MAMVRANRGGTRRGRRMGRGVMIAAAGVAWACGTAMASFQPQVVFERTVGDAQNLIDTRRYAVSDNNHVAFARSNNVIATEQSIIVWQQGQPTRTAFDSTTQAITSLAVNNAGNVAFGTRRIAVSGNVEHAVRVARPGSTATIATTVAPSGSVAFSVGGYSDGGKIGVAPSAGNGVIYTENPGDPTTFVASPNGVEPGQFNRIVSVGVLDNGDSIFTTARSAAPVSRVWRVEPPSGTPQALINVFDTNQGIFNIVASAYSGGGKAAAVGDLRAGGGRGIVSFDGVGTTLLLPMIDGVPLTNLGDTVSINDSGTIALLGRLPVLGNPLILAIQQGNQTIELLRVGDALFGSTVRNLDISAQSLNDAGNLAFYYELADGRSGLAFAAIPAPGVAGMLGIAGLVAARRRRA